MSNGMGSALERPRSAEAWSQVVQEWRRSRQITREFCRTRGLTVKTFQWWRWALTACGGRPPVRRHGPPADVRGPSAGVADRMPPAPVPAFIEVVPRAAPPSVTAERRASGVEVLVVGGRGERRVRVDAGFDVATLRQVVSVLEEV